MSNNNIEHYEKISMSFTAPSNAFCDPSHIFAIIRSDDSHTIPKDKKNIILIGRFRIFKRSSSQRETVSIQTVSIQTVSIQTVSIQLVDFHC